MSRILSYELKERETYNSNNIIAMTGDQNVYETLHFDHIRDVKTQEGATYSSLNRKPRTRCILFVVATIVVVLVGISVAVGVSLGVVQTRETQDRQICDLIPLTQKGITVNTSQAKHGDVIELRCSDIKSKLVGPSRITCLSSSTWSPESSCKPKRCTEFPSPQNAIIKKGLDNSEVGEMILVVCNEGFDIVGSDTVICMSNETWSAIPTCEPKDCVFPGNVTNGMILENERTTFNSTLNIQCTEGFNLSGDDHIVCNKNGQWDAMPSCLPLTCGFPLVPNGSIIQINGTNVKDIFVVKCEEGFALQGSTVMQCSDNGTWTPNSICNETFAPKCPEGWVAFEDSCYLFWNNTSINVFAKATEICEQEGSRIVFVETEEENNFLKSYLRPMTGNFWWIGMTDQETEGTWKWYGTNNVVTFTDWAIGEPNGGRKENCAQFFSRHNHSWNDRYCSSLETNYTFYVICERNKILT